jgi:DNA adenine methylase
MVASSLIHHYWVNLIVPILIPVQRGSVRPPLRWAGSKRSQVRQLMKKLPGSYNKYIEPFAGSACLFFFLRPHQAVLGDLNSELMRFYDTLASQPLAVVRRLRTMRDDGQDYYNLRDQDTPTNSVKAAARFLYLNRFCFNGVYRTNRLGRFNVPRGNHTGSLPSRKELLLASELLFNATRIAGDFDETLAMAERGDFVYLDPPYARRKAIRPGEYGYNSLDGEEDLDRLACSLHDLNSRGVKYLVSYMRSKRAAEVIPHQSVQFIRVKRNVGGFVATRRTATEMLLANYSLRRG